MCEYVGMCMIVKKFVTCVLDMFDIQLYLMVEEYSSIIDNIKFESPMAHLT